MPKKRKSRTPLPQHPQPEPISQPEPKPDSPIMEQQYQQIVDQIQHKDEEIHHDFLQKPDDEEDDDKDIPIEDEDKQLIENENENENESNGGIAEEDNVDEDDDEDEDEDEPIEKLLEPFTKEQLASLLKEAVTKYPSFVENVRKVADLDPVHRKIFVHGLGWDTTSEALVTVFSEFGEVEDCKAVVDKATGKSKGYAFILFKHRSGAKKALREPQKKIGSRVASCQLASAGPVSGPPAQVAVAPVSEHTQRKIFVSNVGADIDIGKLVEFFSKFGEIEEGPLGLDRQSGKPKGFCLFVYKSLDSARKALEEPHKTFEGQILHCQKAVDGPKMNKGGISGGFQPQQHHGQHHHSHQPYYGHTAKKGKYSGGSGSGGFGATGGHMMAPGVGPAAGGYNSAAPGAMNPALGQALAFLASQGSGLGLGNLLGGMGAPADQGVGVQPGGYGGQGGGVYGQAGVQGGYANPQMPQGGVRPYQGGAPYMGHGH